MGIIDADTHIDETDATRRSEKILRAVTPFAATLLGKRTHD